MKCICRQITQALVGKKVVTFDAGSVAEFDKCPRNFEVLEGEDAAAIDFATAEKEELNASKWTFEGAAEAMSRLYGRELEKKDGATRADIVDAILDIRYRHVDGDLVKLDAQE